MVATASGWRRGFGRFFWDEINAARMPRMAFANSFGREYTTLACAVLADSFECIVGTCRIKSAAPPKQGADAILVSAQQKQEQQFH